MNFDIPTLMAAGALATAVAGLLTAMAWFADREASALPWWATAYFLLAGGITGLIFGGMDPRCPTTILSSLAFSMSPGLIWTGARVFGHRRPHIAAMTIG